MKPPSPLLRAIRAVVGLVVVGYLAFGAYHPAAASGADCSSEGGMAHMQPMADSAPVGTPTTPVASASTHHADCGLTCCPAAATAPLYDSAASRLVPIALAFSATAPASVTRTPQPPPPELTA